MSIRTAASSALRIGFTLLVCTSLCAADGITDPKKGKGGSEIQGAAGTSGAQGEASSLEKCDKPMGAVAVVEPQTYIQSALSQYGLQSPTPLIRMMIQQSNCFIVVERGQGMQNMMQERQLQESGQLRQSSNVGGGQMVTADFVLTPTVAFSEKNAGGLGGALGGVLGKSSGGSLIGAVAGGLKFKEAQTSMLLADARSGVQVASAEGSVKKADLGLGALVGSTSGAAGGIGGYGNTNEGKIVASGFLDNYNNLVRVVRNDASLQREVGSLKDEAGKKVQAGAVFSEGDVLHPKIGNVKLLSKPADGSAAVATLGKGDELIFSGKEEGGYVQVESANGSGWVKKILVVRQ